MPPNTTISGIIYELVLIQPLYFDDDLLPNNNSQVVD